MRYLGVLLSSPKGIRGIDEAYISEVMNYYFGADVRGGMKNTVSNHKVTIR
jgi:hypothetical protein